MSGGHFAKLQKAGHSGGETFEPVFEPNDLTPPNFESDFFETLEKANKIKSRCVLVKAFLEGTESYLQKSFIPDYQYGVKIKNQTIDRNKAFQ